MALSSWNVVTKSEWKTQHLRKVCIANRNIGQLCLKQWSPLFLFLIMVTSAVGISVPSIFFNLVFDWSLRVFFIHLQDMHQIKEVESFQRYHLFCGIWQRKTISSVFLAVWFILPLRHESNHFVAFSSRNLGARQKKAILFCDCVTQLVHLRRHLSYPFHDLAM